MEYQQGINNNELKRKNRGLVLQLICCGRILSRVDVAKKSGLTKMTVTNIVNQFIQDHYLVERKAIATSSAGRNPIRLDIAPTAPKVVGVYISRNALTVIVTDLKLRKLYADRLPLKEETRFTLTVKLFRLLDRAVKQYKSHRILGIGIAAIGPLDCANGILLNPNHFFGITNYPVAELLNRHYRIPVILNNDTNAAALAEKMFGEVRNLQNFIYLGLDNGVGAGIISNGQLYQNRSGLAGEIGHISVDYKGERCSCGSRGCLETLVNIPVILKNMEALLKRPVTADLIPLFGDEEPCFPYFKKILHILSAALTGVVNLLDPECIVIGHQGVYFPDEFLELMEEEINRHILAKGYTHVRVVKSSFETDAPLYGSVCCVLNQVFCGELPLI